MKKTTKYILASCATLSILALPLVVGAQFDPTRESGNTGLSTKSAYEVLVTIMRYGLVILTILGVIGFIISGIIYITAGGAGKADAAQKWLTYSILGVIVGLVGYIIIRLIDSLLHGQVQT